MNTALRKWTIAGAVWLLPFTQGVFAQDDIGELADFVVEDVPADVSILPTSRTIESMFGSGRGIMTTPRSVSVITREMLELRGIEKVEQLGQYSPGLFSPSVYGVPGVPTIRGAFAEVFQNGQRRRFQRLAYAPSFRSIEAMDIIKGTANVVYGPVTRGGGILNFVTKKPFFERSQTEFRLQFGDWVLGNGSSYASFAFSVDNTGPINDQWAYRVTAGIRNADSWYRNVYDNMAELHLSLAYRHSERTHVEMFFAYEDYENNEALGINRPTQASINSGLYIAGPATPSYAGEEAVVDPDTAREVYLDGWETVTHPESGGSATRFAAQTVVNHTISDTLSLRNSTLYEYLESRKFSPHSFSNYNPGSHLLDNRIELMLETDLSGMASKTTTGAAVRYDSAESYIDFIDEVFALYDLTADPSTFANPFFPDYWVNAGVNGFIPGKGDRYRSQISGARRSTATQLGVFIQQELEVNRQLSLLGGLRADRTRVTAERPLLLDGNGDPIATTGPSTRASASVTNPAYMASVITRPAPWMSAYFTYNYVESAQGDDFNAFSIIDGDPVTPGLQPAVNKLDLEVENELFEVGLRFSLLDNALYLNFGAFRQDRVRTDRENNKIALEVEGFEFELAYQPNVRLTFYANASYTWARQPNYRPAPYTKNYLDAFHPSTIVDGQPGTGVGAPNFGYNPYTVGTWRLNSLPDTIVNLGATYMFESGLGLTSNIQFIDSFPLNVDNTLMIPSSVQVGIGVFYRWNGWEYKIDLMNAFNERIITPVATAAGNDIFMVERPRRVSGSVRYRF